VGIGVGVAGCLSSGSNITYPEQTGESDGSEEPDETESPEESEEPSGTPINTRLADETTRVYDELRWFETEYDATMQQYRSRLRDVYTETESLLETIADEGRLDAQPLEDVETLAADVASTVTEIPEPQFTNHISFAAVNDDGFPEAKRFRDREDWDRVEDELEYVARIYGNASTIKATKERYSPNPIDNRLYGWLGGDEAGTMFEIRHLSDDPDQHDDADQRLPGHGVYVVSDSSREIEYLDRPMGGETIRRLVVDGRSVRSVCSANRPALSALRSDSRCGHQWQHRSNRNRSDTGLRTTVRGPHGRRNGLRGSRCR